jgi:hypothetical protein
VLVLSDPAVRPLLLRLRGASETGGGAGQLAEDLVRADHVVWRWRLTVSIPVLKAPI